MSIEEKYSVILDCAFEVHNTLGAGLLENTYKHCFAYELTTRGMSVEVEKELPVSYKGIDINCGYRIDLLVDGCIIIELKSVSRLNDIHLAQILSYMKLSNIKLGLLINFNTKFLKQGIRRVIL